MKIVDARNLTDSELVSKKKDARSEYRAHDPQAHRYVSQPKMLHQYKSDAKTSQHRSENI